LNLSSFYLRNLVQRLSIAFFKQNMLSPHNSSLKTRQPVGLFNKGEADQFMSVPFYISNMKMQGRLSHEMVSWCLWRSWSHPTALQA
jgi:hypothetical protein